jgi:hypothetical protein
MSVTKSKFESEAGGAALDIDDPGKKPLSSNSCSHHVSISNAHICCFIQTFGVK